MVTEGGWRVTDGGWRVTDGGWRVTDGGWRVTDGGWRVADVGWRVTDGGWRVTDGGWRVTDGGWRVTDGGWRVTDGGWRVTDGGWRVTDGGWRVTDGGWGVTDGGWRVTDGGWRVTDGGWRVTDGGWRVTDGGWRVTDGGWRVTDGSWGVTDGGWRVTDGGWRVTDGGWRVTDGGWRVTDGGWRVTDGGWRVTDGGWRVTDGGWRVTDGGWRVTDGGWRVTDGGWRVTDGGWRSTCFIDTRGGVSTGKRREHLKAVPQLLNTAPQRLRGGPLRTRAALQPAAYGPQDAVEQSVRLRRRRRARCVADVDLRNTMPMEHYAPGTLWRRRWRRRRARCVADVDLPQLTDLPKGRAGHGHEGVECAEAHEEAELVRAGVQREAGQAVAEGPVLRRGRDEGPQEGRVRVALKQGPQGVGGPRDQRPRRAPRPRAGGPAEHPLDRGPGACDVLRHQLREDLGAAEGDPVGRAQAGPQRGGDGGRQPLEILPERGPGHLRALPNARRQQRQGAGGRRGGRPHFGGHDPRGGGLRNARGLLQPALEPGGELREGRAGGGRPQRQHPLLGGPGVADAEEAGPVRVGPDGARRHQRGPQHRRVLVLQEGPHGRGPAPLPKRQPGLEGVGDEPPEQGPGRRDLPRVRRREPLEDPGVEHRPQPVAVRRHVGEGPQGQGALGARGVQEPHQHLHGPAVNEGLGAPEPGHGQQRAGPDLPVPRGGDEALERRGRDGRAAGLGPHRRGPMGEALRRRRQGAPHEHLLNGRLRDETAAEGVPALVRRQRLHNVHEGGGKAEGPGREVPGPR